MLWRFTKREYYSRYGLENLDVNGKRVHNLHNKAALNFFEYLNFNRHPAPWPTFFGGLPSSLGQEHQGEGREGRWQQNAFRYRQGLQMTKLTRTVPLLRCPIQPLRTLQAP
jgi:hypothetical protein